MRAFMKSLRLCPCVTWKRSKASPAYALCHTNVLTNPAKIFSTSCADPDVESKLIA